MIETRIGGLPDLRQALQGLVPKLRVRALRNALAAGARLVQRAARQQTPVLDPAKPDSARALARGWRRPGTVRKAISVRTSKLARRRGDVGVFVNVKQLKRGQRGARNAADPFYWRWLNWGWTPARASHGRGAAGMRFRRRQLRAGVARAIPGARFLEAGAAQLQAALSVIMAKLPQVIEKLNRPRAPAP